MTTRRWPKFIKTAVITLLISTILLSDDSGRGILDKKSKRTNQQEENTMWPYTDEELKFINGE